MSDIDFKMLDAKWQEYWKQSGLYKTPEKPDPAKKFYLLEMFAYPSGDIHIGHFRNYTIGDVIWRFHRMQGKDLLHPFGWDAFGLPAEQAAIKRNIHPEEWTEGNIATGESTLESLGISYDWDREVVTCRPDYYRWTQWVFLKLYERGLTFQDEALVNWCPECNTVLANEQVSSEGTCWRHTETKVTKKYLKQWYFKITEYAQRLLDGLDGLEGSWPPSTIAQQRNWIGRSEGAEIRFKLKETDDPLPIFTTRPDTIYGVTFMAIAPDAPLMRKLAPLSPNREAVEAYMEQAQQKTEIERTAEGVEKDGVDTGLTVINPFNHHEVPLFVADYVLGGYGSGAVMAVPAHDTRDFAFARKYGLDIVPVIHPEGEEALDPAAMKDAYTQPGIMHDSGPFNGLPSTEGIQKTAEYALDKGFGKATVNFKLRNWLLSRQRYWGAPIPVIHCKACGAVPVPEQDLPVVLPMVRDFLPKGRSPLEDVPEFLNTECPKCHAPAQRDPDTMDTFVCSSWYHFRYSDPKNQEKPWEKDAVDAWLPVDFYIGGSEHAMGHLIYFRFITKVLFDMGYVSCEEPAKALFHHGMVYDEKGEKMSKSKGNVVSPVHLVREWGVDIPRTSMLFLAPPDRKILWTETGMNGARRFLSRYAALVDSLIEAGAGVSAGLPETGDQAVSEYDRPYFRYLHQTIRKVTQDLKEMQFNTAIAAMMEFLNNMSDYDPARSAMGSWMISVLPRLISPFAPHLGEELWERAGGAPSVFNATWPAFDPAACQEDVVNIPVQIKGKLRAVLILPKGTSQEDALASALADTQVQRYVPDPAKIRKVVFVPDKILNLIV
ncbi:MAG: leucine--tRNA ligase [Planctomycetota bacterium]